jgi:hypothetical protein
MLAQVLAQVWEGEVDLAMAGGRYELGVEQPQPVLTSIVGVHPEARGDITHGGWAVIVRRRNEERPAYLGGVGKARLVYKSAESPTCVHCTALHVGYGDQRCGGVLAPDVISHQLNEKRGAASGVGGNQAHVVVDVASRFSDGFAEGLSDLRIDAHRAKRVAVGRLDITPGG